MGLGLHHPKSHQCWQYAAGFERRQYHVPYAGRYCTGKCSRFEPQTAEKSPTTDKRKHPRTRSEGVFGRFQSPSSSSMAKIASSLHGTSSYDQPWLIANSTVCFPFPCDEASGHATDIRRSSLQITDFLFLRFLFLHDDRSKDAANRSTQGVFTVICSVSEGVLLTLCPQSLPAIHRDFVVPDNFFISFLFSRLQIQYSKTLAFCQVLLSDLAGFILFHEYALPL